FARALARQGSRMSTLKLHACEHVDPALKPVFFAPCPHLHLYRSHFERHGYRLATAQSTECGALVFCRDGLDAAAAMAPPASVPKFVVGADPPTTWINAQRLDLPLLPVDLERRLLKFLDARPRTGTRRYRVLIIDDNETIRRTAGRALEDAGFDVRGVGGFAAVFAALQDDLKHQPEFILLDLNLPGMSGEALGKLIQRFAIPIAIFSSEGAERLAEARKSVGAIAAFDKGMAMGEIARKIRHHLDARR
ncbi:MAG TPA: response regulator, partial [Polyangiaceae bacterium]